MKTKINTKKLSFLVDTLNTSTTNSYYTNSINSIENDLFTQNIHINNKKMYKNTLSLYNLIKNPPLIPSTHYINSKLKIKSFDKNLDINTKIISTNNATDTNTCIDNIFNKLQKKNNLYKYISINLNNNPFNNSQLIEIAEKDSIYIGFCILIYDSFLLLDENQQRIFMKELKYKMSIDLYKFKLNYKYVKFKKSEFQEQLINNICLDKPYFYQYLGDYFDLNIIISNDKQIQYLNSYKKDRYSILLFKMDSRYIISYNLKGVSLVNNEYIKQFNIIEDKDILSKNKNLSEIQDIACRLGISIKKPGKTKQVNKTKLELLNEINL